MNKSDVHLQGLYHVRFLDQELARRSRSNARYSLRAFAAQLDLHPSALSRILAGKQRLSKAAAVKVAENLALKKEASRLFLQSVVDEHRKDDALRMGEAVEAPALRPCALAVNEQLFAKIACIRAFAILELTFTKGFQSSPGWIAGRLGISASEVERCIAILLETRMLERVGGKLVNRNRHINTVNGKKNSEARIKLHQSVLNQALASLEKDSDETRGHFCMSLAADPSQLAKAKAKILEFMESLGDLLGSSDPTEVYELSVQLFPMTK